LACLLEVPEIGSPGEVYENPASDFVSDFVGRSDIGIRLLGLDTVVLTPHAAGLTERSAARMSLAAARNIKDIFAGRLDQALVVNAAAINRED